MIRLTLILVMAASPLFAQTGTPPPKTRLAQCRSDLENSEAARKNWNQLYDRLDQERARLEAKLKKLDEAHATLMKDHNELKVVAQQVLTYTVRLDAEYSKMLTSYGSLVGKYNGLLERANSQLAQANARLSKKQRLSNALLMYSLMPKYNAPMTLRVNFSDCTKFPALCVQ